MNERIKNLRKTLGLNQTEFGKRFGAKQTTIAGYENGARTPTDIVINSICAAFNVNEEWLRTGEGEMFIEIPEEDLYSKAAASLLKEDDALGMEGLKLYWSLSPELRRAAEDHILMLADMIREHRNKKE